MQAEGHPIAPGTTGENLTVSGIDWSRVAPGACLDIAEVRLEITAYAAPCGNITGSFVGGDIARVAEKRNPGWSRVYARVLVPGHIRVGDTVTLLDREDPKASQPKSTAARVAAATCEGGCRGGRAAATAVIASAPPA